MSRGRHRKQRSLIQRGKRSARSVTGILDVGISSLGNLVLSVIAARNLPLPSFGLFSATMLAGIIYVGISRAFFGDPLVLRYSAHEAHQQRASASDALSSALTSTLLIAPIVGGLLYLVLALSGAGPHQAVRLAGALALVSPFLVVQELVRTAGYATGRPATSLLNSLTWTALLIGGLGLGQLRGFALGDGGYIVLWGCTSLGGAVVGSVLLGVWPRLGGLGAWHRRHTRLTRRLLLDYALTQVTAEGALLLILMVAGADEVGILRKAQIPLAPITVVTGGIIAVAQPALVRRVANGVGSSGVQRFTYTLAAMVAAAAIVLGLIVSVLPERLMREVVGQDWASARALVPYLAVYLALGAVAACQGIALRALHQLSAQLRLRLYLTPAVLALVCLSAVGGVFTAVLGLLSGLILVVATWAHLLRRTEDVAPTSTLQESAWRSA